MTTKLSIPCALTVHWTANGLGRSSHGGLKIRRSGLFGRERVEDTTPVVPPARLSRLHNLSVGLAAAESGDRSTPGVGPEEPRAVKADIPSTGPTTVPGWTADDLPPVPWKLDTTIVVFVCWLLGFYLAAYDIVPALLSQISSPWKESLGSSGMQAVRHLVLDVTQLSMTLGILFLALRKYHPRKLGLFAIRLSPVTAWLPVVLVGCCSFPLIHWIHKQIVALLGAPMPTADGSLISHATNLAKAMWFGVLAICAPLWEEIMFRGFILPSLWKRMHPIAAVLLTSLIFASVHFTREGFLPLLLLGMLFGAAYLKTVNLVPAIILHSLWNVGLLLHVIVNAV